MPAKSAVLCDKHFTVEDFQPAMGSVTRLKEEAIPHVFDFPNSKENTSKARTSLNSRQAEQRPGVGADPLSIEPSAQLDPNEDTDEPCFDSVPVRRSQLNVGDSLDNQYGHFLSESSHFTEEDNAAAAILCALSLQKSTSASTKDQLSEADQQTATSFLTPETSAPYDSDFVSVGRPVSDSQVLINHKQVDLKRCDFSQQYSSISSGESSSVLDHSYGSKKGPETPTKSLLRKKVKRLQNKLNRQKKKVNHLEDIVANMKDQNMVTESCSDLLLEQFSGLPLELFKHESTNLGRMKNCYSEEIRKMAVTLHFYSPRGYEYMRTFLTLPHPRTLRNWKSSVHNEPGFFPDVFKVYHILI